MKKIIFVALSLILLTACERKQEIDPYLCPCDHEQKMVESHFSKDVLLFKSEDVPADVNKKENFWIQYDKEDEQAVLWNIGDMSGWGYIYRLCNYPDYAKKWNIPKNGLKVHLEGIVYEFCGDFMYFPEYTYFDFVLTSLTKK